MGHALKIEFEPGKRIAGTEWTIVGYDRETSLRNRRKVWRCRCSCGVESLISGQRLRNGESRRCRWCSYKLAKLTREETMGRRKLHGEEREDGPGVYLPTREQIQAECRKIREEMGHVFSEQFDHR